MFRRSYARWGVSCVVVPRMLGSSRYQHASPNAPPQIPVALSNEPLSKAPAFKPFMPMRQVLVECFSSTETDTEKPSNEQLKKWLDLLHENAIFTATNWQKLPDDRKETLEKEGLPFSVINSLNEAVRVGLLMPAFKYAKECEFLTTGDHLKYAESRTITEHALLVDDAWRLDRKNCDALCVNMQFVVELTQKYFLLRWTNYCNSSSISGKHFPMTQDLVALYQCVNECKPTYVSLPLCSESALGFVTNCGVNSKYHNVSIPCLAFFEAMKSIDPYLLAMWKVMRETKPVREVSGKPLTMAELFVD